MTTTIVPSVGNSPLMTQAGTGASPGYQAIDVRRMAEPFDTGEGVKTYGSFLVTQRGAGANQSVDINMDDVAWIRGDAVGLQGLYPCPPHSATINESVTAADATNPRIDRIILELKDNTHDASGSNLVQTRVVAGTPTSGATLDNLTGAAAVPSSALLLADILVPAASTSVTNANIRDRRPFQVGTVPPLLSDFDIVHPRSPATITAPNNSSGTSADIAHASHDLAQTAVLIEVPRRIVSATRIRWKYVQGTAVALTGNYVLALYDASGRKIIDTGSVAFTGAINTVQTRSETITATTFEPGMYYLLFGVDTTAGTAGHTGWVAIDASATNVVGSPFVNLACGATTGGVTAPTTLLGLTDAINPAGGLFAKVPRIALSVG